MMMSRRAGFTLIELIVAIVIVMVLGAVAYASYVGFEAKSRDNAAIGLADQLAANLQHYAALNNGAYPSSAGAGWSTEMGYLGSYAEFPATQPSVLNNLAVYSDGATTFQIQFKAAGGTGTVYCRDLNGLGTLSVWNGNAGPWTGCP
jgi:prepilin-type N-terminal cleavage/methylation domain-containing protein